MRTKLLLLLLLANFSIHAQYTTIADINFEKKLIALGVDSGPTDGQVLTSKISKLTVLEIQNSSITDLTGIEDFVSLTNLICRDNYIITMDISKLTELTALTVSNNKLKSIDLSKNVKLNWLDIQRNELIDLDVTNNIALKTFYCGFNNLTTINISKNILLVDFYCSLNPITSLDVINNTALKSLICSSVPLTALDLSKNKALITLDCSASDIKNLDVSNCSLLTSFKCDNATSLISLNLKNGNNTNFTIFDIRRNYALKCAQVDDPLYSNRYWLSLKEATTSFSATCTLGIEDSVFNKVVMYPNPTKDEVHINNIALEKATVYNALGQLVKTFVFNNGETNNTINLSGLPRGVYYVYLINGDAASAKKVIVE